LAIKFVILAAALQLQFVRPETGYLSLESLAYIIMPLPIEAKWDPQTILFAITLTLANAGIRIAIKRAITAITTSNSTNVNPSLAILLPMLSPLNYSCRSPVVSTLLPYWHRYLTLLLFRDY